MMPRRKKKIALPDLSKASIVLFHYDPSVHPKLVVIQVPNHNLSDSSTYRLRLDSAEDMEYLIHLKNGLEIYDVFRTYGKALYKPSTGTVESVEALFDDKTTPSRFHSILKDAERVHRQASGRPYKGFRKRTALRR